VRKIALVTGAGTGIGRACALALARDGYGVLALYRTSQAGAQAVCDSIRAQGGDAQAMRCDVSDSAEVARVARDALARVKHIDALVHCAGIAQDGLLTDMTDEAWRAMMGVHLDGAFYLARAFLPGMISRRTGSVVFVSSMWGQVGASCEAAYSAAKAGVIGLTKALCKEVGPSGVRVNCVAPGCIDTAMMAEYDGETRAALCEETPLLRIGTPEECAGAVRFLCSSEAAFITGQVLGVNGGFVV
jgi:3-oxoacyl-[acyl-carrier protein] reductase